MILTLRRVVGSIFLLTNDLLVFVICMCNKNELVNYKKNYSKYDQFAQHEKNKIHTIFLTYRVVRSLVFVHW